ncbi:MAG: hypothetical protein ONB44_11460 [candidate division KSB1 bacterium]|nr:hypothetical protein [candidate division KSB1 bacterium]MDZ7302741.1 hypothetical protein [candidate division KSB1 bacterium]MDZ7310090.1 hypothetical protein [candidate division KSB1 bacterium]
MAVITRYLDPTQIPFDDKRVCSFLKIRKKSDRLAIINEMIARLYDQYRSDFEPRYRYQICRVTAAQSSAFRVLLDNGVSFTGKGIYQLLAQARYAAVFILTVGDKVETRLAKLSQEDFAEAYFLDGIASAMADGLLRVLRHELDKEAVKLGCELSYRFSPGYARWDLPEQEKIFKLLKAEEIGITLTEAYFMVPQKSLSGVYGFRSKT